MSGDETSDRPRRRGGDLTVAMLRTLCEQVWLCNHPTHRVVVASYNAPLAAE